MAVEGELARAGIVTTDDATVFTKDVEVTNDAIVKGELTAEDNCIVGGVLFVGGTVVGNLEAYYYLITEIIPVDALDSFWLVVPTDGDGDITNVRWVCTENLAGGADTAVITISVNGVACATTITIPDTAVVGDTGVQAIPAGTTVAPGDNVEVEVTNVSATGEVKVAIEITREA
jgi:hypothetical protein